MPFDFIREYTVGKTMLDKQFSIELYNFLRSFYSVEDFVKSMIFMQNTHSPYFAFYIPSERQLIVNFDKIANDIHTYLNNLNIDNKDKVLALHLCLFHFINHEFKHILQEKNKENNPYTIENRLLTLSDWLEQHYSKRDMLFSHYKIDPIERQAELSSLSEVINMAKQANISTLVTEMTNRYLRNAIEGYCDTLKCYPAKHFLEDYRYICVHRNSKIENLLSELDQYPINQTNLQTRIELGLRIKESEYKTLELKK